MDKFNLIGWAPYWISPLFLLISSYSCAVEPHPGITIISPAQNTIVRPGDTVRVQVDIDPVLQPTVLFIAANMRYGIDAEETTSPPWEVDVVIPSNLTGSIPLGIEVQTASGDWESGPELNLNVIPDEAPVTLDPVNNWYSLRPSNVDGTFPDSVDERRITVLGDFASDVERNLTSSMFGTTYTSNDPSVVTVTTEGVLEPQSPGQAFVAVGHNGLKAFVFVEVQDTVSGTLPPKDVTDKASIVGSGFRRDLKTGLFRQVVTITNNTEWPLSRLRLALVGLTEAVRLTGRVARTENISPVGSPYVLVEPAAPNYPYLDPGESTEITLEFSNPQGAPIDYAPVLISGLKP